MGDCFPNPKLKSLRLIFRASQHNFSAAEFHRHCDEVPHTLVLVRSEAGKTFGGYTPLKWRSNDKTFGEWGEDESGQSFLFSVDKRERYPVTDRKYSVRHHKDFGPIFGGNDLRLGDNCGARDDRAECWFPFSYSDNNTYTRTDATQEELFGATTKVEGKKVLHFRVT